MSIQKWLVGMMAGAFSSGCLITICLFLFGLAGCSGESDTDKNGPGSPAATKATTGIELVNVTFAKQLAENMAPVDPVEVFEPDDTIRLSVEIKGRPRSGKLNGKFFYNDELAAEKHVDLSDLNSGVLISVGQNTFAGYYLTPTDPFPISPHYRVELYFNGAKLGSYPFRVVPPPDALPSVIKTATLAKGVDVKYNPIDATETFSPHDSVHVVCRGDLGTYSWVHAEWYVAGKLDDNGTRSLRVTEDLADKGYFFYFTPEGGWPVGEHEVVLTINGEEAKRLTFQVGE